MWGAIAGDIIGSRYEFSNHKSKRFELFDDTCFFTDDSVMTIAVAKTLYENRDRSDADIKAAAIKNMQRLGRMYPNCGFGGSFFDWIFGVAKPYGSYGNGAAMRVGAAGWFGDSEAEVIRLARDVTEISHDHPEGIKGAESVAVAIFLARSGKSMREIRAHIAKRYYPEIVGMSCDNIRDDYYFNETCQHTVPQAFACFFESVDYEDCIRNAVSIGGDTDTICAISGSVAEAFYGMPEHIEKTAEKYLSDELRAVMSAIEYKK